MRSGVILGLAWVLHRLVSPTEYALAKCTAVGDRERHPKARGLRTGQSQAVKQAKSRFSQSRAGREKPIAGGAGQLSINETPDRHRIRAAELPDGATALDGEPWVCRPLDQLHLRSTVLRTSAAGAVAIPTLVAALLVNLAVRLSCMVSIDSLLTLVAAP